MQSTECAEVFVQQSVPQNSSHLALSLYDEDTPCSLVHPEDRNFAGFNLQAELNDEEVTSADTALQWVDISSLFGQGLIYHTCPNVTWKQHLWKEQYGPVDTYVWFHNPCRSSPAAVTFNVSRLNNGAGACREGSS